MPAYAILREGHRVTRWPDHVVDRARLGNVAKTYIADSELALLLKNASETGERLLVKAGDDCFELKVNPAAEVDDIWAGYDPEKARKVIRRSAALGLHSDRGHIDAVIAEIRSQRGQAPRSWER